VCDDQFYKNGKPMSLNAAIRKVFRNRKKNDEFRKRYDRNQKAREKRATTHSATCPKITHCNCGSNPHDQWCCINFPGTEICNCGAQARIDAKKRQLDLRLWLGHRLARYRVGEGNLDLDALIEKAIAAREKDPVAFEENRKKQEAKFKEMKRQWREEKKWDYRIPADIEQRIAYQEPRPGAHGGYNHWYPACEYSKIVTFPENAKNDYLLGIIEVCQLVLSNPPVVDKNNPQKRVDETLALCHKAWERATKMAAKRRIKGYSRGIK
jgi:hypothetical protein